MVTESSYFKKDQNILSPFIKRTNTDWTNVIVQCKWTKHLLHRHYTDDIWTKL